MRGKRGTLSLTSGKSPSGIRQPSSFRQKNPSISPVTNQTSKTVAHSEIDSLPASTSIVTVRPTHSQHALPLSQRDRLAPFRRHGANTSVTTVRSTYFQYRHINHSGIDSLPVISVRPTHSQSQRDKLVPSIVTRPFRSSSLLLAVSLFLHFLCCS